MNMAPSILVVDDDLVAAELLSEVLAREGYRVEAVTSGMEAVEVSKKISFDMIITDLKMPGMNGIEVLRAFKKAQPHSITIVITAFGSFETAMEAIRNGAYDYISKPFRMDEIKAKVRRGLEQKFLLPSREKADKDLPLSALVGTSPRMLEIYKMIARVSQTNVTVLILGKSGTGKELVARAIHDNSPRAGKPYVTVNCAALPENLLESELFGYMKGAFTDAASDKKGLFEEANGGTCFLDEIGDMPLSIQSKLLRVLQKGEIRRLGGTQTINVDIRVLAATNKDLEAMVNKGQFREDLFYRLHVVTIALPPLRERAVDIPLLADHFFQRAAARSGKDVRGISKEAMEFLSAYDWPGNIRQLENLIEKAVALTNNKVILPADILIDLYEKKPAFTGEERIPTLEEVKKNHIMKVLSHAGGNQNLAADILGINRKTLYRLLRKWEA